ncbi:zinc ribbon domain-containing protein [Streptomyces mirabilis]|uniref:zinc ribbon domain-containing protein n=1 Tax=Streptomyces mirabilis TaxID=68239 RepID=UPI003D9E6ABC
MPGVEAPGERHESPASLRSWTFAQLGAFIVYKAKKAGVSVVYVDPAYTSQECSQCHHIERGNRPSQARFACRSCGFVDHPDRNSSHNIAHHGWTAWVCGVQSTAPELKLIARVLDAAVPITASDGHKLQAREFIPGSLTGGCWWRPVGCRGRVRPSRGPAAGWCGGGRACRAWPGRAA